MNVATRMMESQMSFNQNQEPIKVVEAATAASVATAISVVTMRTNASRRKPMQKGLMLLKKIMKKNVLIPVKNMS